MFQNYFGKFGVETDFVDLIDTAAWESAIKPNTRFLFLETPSNPLLKLPTFLYWPILPMRIIAY